MTPVALFILALFGIPWILGLFVKPPASPQSVWDVLAPLLPVVWTPTILAMIFMRWIGGAVGLRNELATRLRYRRESARWLVVAGVVPIIAMTIAIFAARAAGAGAPWTPIAAYPLMIGVQVITGAVGEELGWRGYVLPRLSKRFGEMKAAWVMGLLWSLWHVPAFFTPGLPHQTMPMFSTLAFIIVFGVFLAFVFNRTGESMLATMLAHLSLNVMTGIGGTQLSSVVFWRTLAGLFGIIHPLPSCRGVHAHGYRAAVKNLGPLGDDNE
jgi:membrane protease YdiL (CAAX protease family)